MLERLREPSDEATWSEFCARYRPVVLGYCLRSGLQYSDAEDVVQLVLAGLSSALPHFRYDRARGRFRSYLFSATRRAIAHLRERCGEQPASLDPEAIARVVSASPAIDELWEEEWIGHHYREAMGILRSDLDALAVVVFEDLLQGRDPERIAALRGTTRANVYKIKQRVRDRLRAVIHQRIEAEDRSLTGHGA